MILPTYSTDREADDAEKRIHNQSGIIKISGLVLKEKVAFLRDRGYTRQQRHIAIKTPHY